MRPHLQQSLFSMWGQVGHLKYTNACNGNAQFPLEMEVKQILEQFIPQLTAPSLPLIDRQRAVDSVILTNGSHGSWIRLVKSG